MTTENATEMHPALVGTTVDEINQMTKAQLLDLAKRVGVPGRHDMSKDALQTILVEAVSEATPHEELEKQEFISDMVAIDEIEIPANPDTITLTGETEEQFARDLAVRPTSIKPAEYDDLPEATKSSTPAESPASKPGNQAHHYVVSSALAPKDVKGPPQLRALFDAACRLRDSKEPDSARVGPVKFTLAELVDYAVEHKMLATKQDPLRIGMYYRKDLIKASLLTRYEDWMKMYGVTEQDAGSASDLDEVEA